MGLKYTATELKKKDRKELEKLIDEEGLEVDEDANIGDLRAALLEVEEPEDDEVDDELDDEEDLPEADDEVDDIEEDEPKPAAKKTPKKTKYTDGGKDGNGNKLLGAKEVATHIGTDAKTLRQFFRSGKGSFEAVGAGGRYEFNEADLPKIKAEFEAWQANKPGRGRASGAAGGSSKKRRGKTQPTAEETIDEIEEVEDLDDLDDIELD